MFLFGLTGLVLFVFEDDLPVLHKLKLREEDLFTSAFSVFVVGFRTVT